MTYEELIAEYGGLSAAARALGKKRQTVYNWKSAGIPDFEQLVIHQKKPKLKPDRGLVAKYRALLPKPRGVPARS